MKTRNLILNALVLFSLICFSSCSTNDDSITETPPQTVELKEVVGEWQMYRDENLESVIDEWTGTEWTTVDQWFANVREDSEIILEFREDGTFVDRYADVETANGVWEVIEEGRYSFNYIQNENINEVLTQRRYITVHCDNTYSLEIEGNNRAIYYYKKIDETECGDLIEYNVSD